MSKEKYYYNFDSKKQFEKWFEEMEDKIDFDEGFYVEFAYKNGYDEDEQMEW